METIHLPHLPDHPLQIGLFTQVTNASFLRQQLLAGNHEFEYAFLDASILLSRKQVLMACFRAVNDLLHDRLKSRNVHSEIVFSLSPTNNIAESFRRFGISDSTTTVLAVKLSSQAESVATHLVTHIQGELIPFSDENLLLTADIPRIRKLYRFDAGAKKATSDSAGTDRVEVQREIEAFILGSMALKGA